MTRGNSILSVLLSVLAFDEVCETFLALESKVGSIGN